MASKVKVGIEVDDHGSLKETAKGARTVDRNLKGASQQSANTTKNFSKLAQGIAGGLVPAYAILASTVFAVSAVFRFLKDAGDLRVLQEGQKTYAAATGIAMQSLVHDIRQAAEGMLDFKSASEAAAIGVASGLRPEQLVALGKGAANVSKLLGRDVTDSFNRLVRGVTKAEPELLDELGITLRLAVAKEKYAAALGKTADALDLAEQKQAVFLEVSDQLETKYNKINEIMNPEANAIGQLAIAFDDILKVVKDFMGVIAIPVAKFFTKNIGSLTIALGLMVIPILKQIIPGLDSWALKSEESARRAKAAYAEASQAMADLGAQRKAATGGIGAVSARASQTVQGLKARRGSGLDKLQRGEELKPRQITGMQRAIRTASGEYVNLSKKLRMQLDADLTLIAAKTKSTTQKMTLSFKGFVQKLR